MYNFIFKQVICRLDAEFAHKLGGIVLKLIPGRRLSAKLPVETMGLTFLNPIGMAAGFDKNGKYLRAMSRRGFGHIEVGTVTAKAQPGNPKPRLFRLVKQRALINRMGFNNLGADALAKRLAKYRKKPSAMIVGVNLGKTKVTALDQAATDYCYSAKVLAPYADYLVVNVSSPNTPGLRGLQELEQLRPLLTSVQAAAEGSPLLLKIAPDLSDAQIIQIANLVLELGLAGIIATNTTISRDDISADEKHRDEAGGLSGAPLSDRSLAVLRKLREVLPKEICVISVGGVETAEQFRQRLDSGATLVQGYSAFIYQGPNWARRLLAKL